MRRFLLGLLIVAMVTSLIFAGCAQSATPQELPKAAAIATAGAGGGGHTCGVGIASVLSKYASTTFTALPNPTTDLVRQSIVQGDAEMGYASGFDATAIYHGAFGFEKVGPVNLRVIKLVQQSWMLSLLVRKDLNITTIAGLKGRTLALPKGMLSNSKAIEAILMSGGLTFNDLKVLDVASIDDSAKAMKEGRADVVGIRTGAKSALEDLNSVVPVRYIDCKATSIENEKKMFEINPSVFYTTMKGGDAPWIPQDMTVLGQHQYFYTTDKTSDQFAYNVTKVLYEHYDELAPIHPDLKIGFKPELSVSPTTSIPFHPGAIKYYKEVGIWTSEMDKVQKQLIANQGKLSSGK